MCYGYTNILIQTTLPSQLLCGIAWAPLVREIKAARQAAITQKHCIRPLIPLQFVSEQQDKAWIIIAKKKKNLPKKRS
jgi:hypothetical protein